MSIVKTGIDCRRLTRDSIPLVLRLVREEGVRHFQIGSDYADDGAADRVVGNILLKLAEEGTQTSSIFTGNGQTRTIFPSLIAKLGYFRHDPASAPLGHANVPGDSTPPHYPTSVEASLVATLQDNKAAQAQAHHQSSSSSDPSLQQQPQELYHSIHPDILGEALHNSLVRSGTNAVEYVLLENPEHFLIEALPKGHESNENDIIQVHHELKDRLERAYSYLNEQKQNGYIEKGFGISSVSWNTTTEGKVNSDITNYGSAAVVTQLSKQPHCLSFDLLLNDISTKFQNFNVIEIPINPIETSHLEAFCRFQNNQREHLNDTTRNEKNHSNNHDNGIKIFAKNAFTYFPSKDSNGGDMASATGTGTDLTSATSNATNTSLSSSSPPAALHFRGTEPTTEARIQARQAFTMQKNITYEYFGLGTEGKKEDNMNNADSSMNSIQDENDVDTNEAIEWLRENILDPISDKVEAQSQTGSHNTDSSDSVAAIPRGIEDYDEFISNTIGPLMLENLEGLDEES
eukprot:g143.t1